MVHQTLSRKENGRSHSLHQLPPSWGCRWCHSIYLQSPPKMILDGSLLSGGYQQEFGPHPNRAYARTCLDIVEVNKAMNQTKIRILTPSVALLMHRCLFFFSLFVPILKAPYVLPSHHTYKPNPRYPCACCLRREPQYCTYSATLSRQLFSSLWDEAPSKLGTAIRNHKPYHDARSRQPRLGFSR